MTQYDVRCDIWYSLHSLQIKKDIKNNNLIDRKK